jgi:hypothetical protein
MIIIFIFRRNFDGITYGSAVGREKNSGSRAEYLAMPPVSLFG